MWNRIIHLPRGIMILFLIVGLINLMVPFAIHQIKDGQSGSDQLVELMSEARDVSLTDTYQANGSEAGLYINRPVQTAPNYLSIQGDTYSLMLNDQLVRDGVALPDAGIDELGKELMEAKRDLALVTVALSVLFGLLYGLLVALLLIVTVRMLLRHRIKVGQTIPLLAVSMFLTGSIALMLTPIVSQLLVLYAILFIMNGTIFALLVRKELTQAMAKDQLGEGDLSDGIY